MPQLYQVLSPQPVTLINPLSGDKTIAARADAEKLEKAFSPAYKVMNQTRAWSKKRTLRKVKEQN